MCVVRGTRDGDEQQQQQQQQQHYRFRKFHSTQQQQFTMLGTTDPQPLDILTTNPVRALRDSLVTRDVARSSSSSSSSSSNSRTGFDQGKAAAIVR